MGLSNYLCLGLTLHITGLPHIRDSKSEAKSTTLNPTLRPQDCSELFGKVSALMMEVQKPYPRGPPKYVGSFPNFRSHFCYTQTLGAVIQSSTPKP